MTDPTDHLLQWCLQDGVRMAGPEALIAGFARACHAVGVSVDRIAVTMRTLHPQLAALGWVYQADRPFEARQYGARARMTDAYAHSPIRLLRERQATRIHLPLQGENIDRFPIARDLHEDGFTDYLALALVIGEERDDGVEQRHFATLATRAPQGFTLGCVEALERVMAAFALLLDRFALQTIARNVCETYIGRNTGRRVLAGQIHRGAIDTVRAAVWFSDLRGFTRRTQKLGSQGTVDLLNQWFDVVGEAVTAEGGEILKFIGDAALVIFPVDERGPSDACARALRGAQRTLRGVEGLDTPDGEPITFGVGLSLGEVGYGNIGAADRLDFTVIGHTVNVAARLEGLCAATGEAVLTSDEFAAAIGSPMRSVGAHALKGVDAPMAVFAPE